MDEIKIMKGGSAVDDRGVLKFVNDFDFAGVKRFYQVENHDRNFIRAWHGHKKEAKYVYVSSGAILIGAYKINEDGVLHKTVLDSSNPQVLYIPSGYYNGFMNLKDNTHVIFFSTSTLEESKGDDIRLPYNHWNIWNKDYR